MDFAIEQQSGLNTTRLNKDVQAHHRLNWPCISKSLLLYRQEPELYNQHQIPYGAVNAYGKTAKDI